MLPPILGSTITDAILATQACQVDLKEGRDCTNCVTMVISRAANNVVEFYAWFELERGMKLRDKLYR